MLLRPGHIADWFIGVKATNSNKLFGFIAALPIKMKVNNTGLRTAHIQFMCVHKKLRKKRLAPILMEELKRVVGSSGSVQVALYSSGETVPTPAAQC